MDSFVVSVWMKMKTNRRIKVNYFYIICDWDAWQDELPSYKLKSGLLTSQVLKQDYIFNTTLHWTPPIIEHRPFPLSSHPSNHRAIVLYLLHCKVFLNYALQKTTSLRTSLNNKRLPSHLVKLSQKAVNASVSAARIAILHHCDG